MGHRGVKVIDAWVAALAMPGDYAKYRICKALMDLTEQKIPYDPQATQRQRDKAVKQWQDWWKQRQSNRLKR